MRIHSHTGCCRAAAAGPHPLRDGVEAEAEGEAEGLGVAVAEGNYGQLRGAEERAGAGAKVEAGEVGQRLGGGGGRCQGGGSSALLTL